MYRIEKISNGVCASNGFYASGVSAGLKPDGALDVAFIYSECLCDVASIFTTNKMYAAPIKHFRAKGDFQTNFVLMNSKNANAMTGEAGVKDIDEILQNLTSLHPKIQNPLMSSTGVIGVRLPKQQITDATQKFDLTSKDSSAASRAIMTTDTFAKEIAYEVTLEDGSSFRIGAIAKGAGMINPAMATMLCFITTDANIPKDEMQEILSEVGERTFNAISVDGDTSTNDTVLLLANAEAKAYHKEGFREALYEIMHFLALEMVRDGEGATKLVTYKVSGARSDEEAMRVAKALSDSLLVKTALFGEDPNWGRIASTVGASGVEAYEESLSISFNELCVYEKGQLHFDAQMEQKASEVMKLDRFSISCDLGVGDGSFTSYGCDLGYEYVKINADYRT